VKCVVAHIDLLEVVLLRRNDFRVGEDESVDLDALCAWMSDVSC